MQYNIEYPVSKSDLQADFERTVSLVAAQSTTENGAPVYDSFKVYERNKPEVEKYLKDAVRSFVARFNDVAHVEFDEGGFPSAVSLYLPDVSAVDAEAAGPMMQDFVHDKAVSLWFTTRIPDMAKFYGESAIGKLSEIVILLRSRKRPER